MLIPYNQKNLSVRGFQTHKVKGTNEYLYVQFDKHLDPVAFCNVSDSDKLPSNHCGVTYEYLAESCYPVSFAKLPDYIQNHVIWYLTSIGGENTLEKIWEKRS
jgi:hypothetical protein